MALICLLCEHTSLGHVETQLAYQNVLNLVLRILSKGNIHEA